MDGYICMYVLNNNTFSMGDFVKHYFCCNLSGKFVNCFMYIFLKYVELTFNPKNEPKYLFPIKLRPKLIHKIGWSPLAFSHSETQFKLPVCLLGKINIFFEAFELSTKISWLGLNASFLTFGRQWKGCTYKAGLQDFSWSKHTKLVKI
jgi:hypothetical protein